MGQFIGCISLPSPCFILSEVKMDGWVRCGRGKFEAASQLSVEFKPLIFNIVHFSSIATKKTILITPISLSETRFFKKMLPSALCSAPSNSFFYYKPSNFIIMSFVTTVTITILLWHLLLLY